MCPLFCISRRGCTYGLNNGTFQSHEGDVSGLVFESAHQGASRQWRFHFGDDLPPQEVHIATLVWVSTSGFKVKYFTPKGMAGFNFLKSGDDTFAIPRDIVYT